MAKLHRHRIKLPTVVPTKQVEFEIIREDEITADVLEVLGLEPRHLPDFWKAMRFISYQARGNSVADACKNAGIPRSELYREHWVQMVTAARNMILGQAMLEVQGVTAVVYQEWPAIVRQLVTDAKGALTARERTAAAQTIYDIFIRDAQGDHDATAERKYLNQPADFNPASILQLVNPTVVINPAPLPAPEEPELVIDVEATEQSSQ